MQLRGLQPCVYDSSDRGHLLHSIVLAGGMLHARETATIQQEALERLAPADPDRFGLQVELDDDDDDYDAKYTVRKTDM